MVGDDWESVDDVVEEISRLQGANLFLKALLTVAVISNVLAVVALLR